MARISNHRWAIDITEMMNVMLRLSFWEDSPILIAYAPAQLLL